MIAEVSRCSDLDDYGWDDATDAATERALRGGRELSGRAKFARASRHKRGSGGRAKLFNGAHLRRQNRHVAW